MKSMRLLGVGILFMVSLAGCAARAEEQEETQVEMQEETQIKMQEEAEMMTREEIGRSTQAEPPDTEGAYHKISAEEAKEKMEKEDVTIVDVRSLQEYKGGHVPEAVNIPNEEIKDTEPQLLGDKEAVILVYCRSGRRSKEAAEKLVKIGYSQVYDFGGIIDWTYETVKEE